MQPDQSPCAQPFYLDTRGGTVLCWWHAPQCNPVALPVLMCPAWGDEEIGAYAGWRALAQSLAEAGVPVLRLDLPGEGDSLPRAAAASAWSAWMDALEDAAEALRQVSGEPRLHLLGLRLGALMAAQVADRLRQRGDHLASLLLLAPVASGRAFLRETRLLSKESQDEPLAAGEFMAGGFVLDAPTVAALNAAQWPRPPAADFAAACPVTLLERSDRPLPEATKLNLAAWAGIERLEGVARDDLAGLTAIAHSAVWPDVTGPILAGLVRAGGGRSRSRGLVWPGVSAKATGPGWTEELVRYGPGLVAQCTRPLAGSGRALVLLSSGAERRIGPHRLWVDFARACAAQGDVCMRLDLAGLGDSEAREVAAAPPSRADLVYDARCVEDVQAALKWLQQTHGITQVRLAGLCSGAYHAWRCAVAGLALTQVVAINPLVYHWRSGMSLDPTDHAFGQIDIADSAVRSLKDPARWMKLLRGQVHVQVILRAMSARVVGRLRTVSRHVGRWLHWPLSEDVVSDLRQVIHHATPLSFVFSAGDPGQALLIQEGGAFLKAQIASGRVHLTTIERSDHTFSTRSGRDSLYNCLNSILSVASESAPREDQNLASMTPQQS